MESIVIRDQNLIEEVRTEFLQWYNHHPDIIAYREQREIIRGNPQDYQGFVINS